jgi:site-specific recombinase XerD
LVAYLTGRSAIAEVRQVFLTLRAPRGPIRADLVGDIVERACLRAGVARVGPHRLRHALARELLRRGAGLRAIGQVLRQQDLATTALYANPRELQQMGENLQVACCARRGNGLARTLRHADYLHGLQPDPVR